jgi:thiosulfate reductase cytochrome b subunit
MTRVYLYDGFNRLWHWLQALLVILLAVTGFEVHYPTSFALLGFQAASEWHRIFAWLFVILIAFAMFWHLTTGMWKQYKPTTRMLPEMIAYYLTGMFKGGEKPVHKSSREKLNPLQRLAYLGLKLMIIPILVTTGFFYLYYNELHAAGWAFIALDWVAVLHTFAAFLMLAFLIMHVYLTTTGETPAANIKAMITGWEELDDEGKRKPVSQQTGGKARPKATKA